MSGFQRRTDEALRIARETRDSGSVAFWLNLILRADQASDTERALATLANMANAELDRLASDEEGK